jgi:beta-phosphoglucomutase-like phosphatase (HAD superfamily)
MNNIFNKFDLFIFDLDDTLIQTEKYHYKAWLKTLKIFLTN